MTEDETVGWHHQLNGHEFGQTLGGSEGQGSLACCRPWGHREGHDLVTGQKLWLTMTVNKFHISFPSETLSFLYPVPSYP